MSQCQSIGCQTDFEHIRETREFPVVGEFYYVDCIVIGHKTMPVLGPAHYDLDFGIKFQHYHLDQRFMTHEQIVDWDVIFWHAKGNEEIETKLMACVRSNFPVGVHLGGIEDKYKGKEAVRDKKTGGFLCPHKGTYLGNIRPTNGCVKCPMHGLKIKHNGKVSGKP